MKKTIKPRGNSKKKTKGKFDLPPVSMIYMNPRIGKAHAIVSIEDLKIGKFTPSKGKRVKKSPRP
jgi:hypothetical protein